VTQHPQTPSQTVGPFFSIGMTWHGGETLYDDATLGERIEIAGRVLDGRGEVVPDALIEIWQANAAGRYADPQFGGFGRCQTDAGGRFTFKTIRPGRVLGPRGALQAPHIDVGVFARGLLKRLFTRCYFSDEAANGADPIMALVPERRRATLIARGRADAPESFVFDIVLRGPSETVFFAC
jgi:protocatechuate 3,4-dioxygenase, alpha subunit